MPTKRGWVLITWSVAAGVGGRALGVIELYLVAAAGPALVMSSVAYVWLRRLRLDVSRRLYPARVTVGGTCRVELLIANRDRSTPVLRLTDGKGGDFLVAAMGAGRTASATYQLPAPKRGSVSAGPLRVRLVDPFATASRRVATLEPSTLVVHPRVEPISPPPEPPGSSQSASMRRPAPSPFAGEDFHSLRPYQDGDDLRTVHWRTSARLDQLVVRLDEPPRIQQTLVALDLREAVHTDATLEHAIVAAASAVAAACASGGVARLVTTAGLDTGMAGGEVHVETVLDALSGVETDGAGHLDAMASLAGEGGDGTLVVITTTAASGDGSVAVAKLRRQWPLAVGVLVADPASQQGPGQIDSLPVDYLVRTEAGTSFSRAWETALAPALAGQ